MTITIKGRVLWLSRACLSVAVTQGKALQLLVEWHFAVDDHEPQYRDHKN